MRKSDWKYSHFKSDEFDCHCKRCKGKDTGLNMNKNFMESLSVSRSHSDVPYRIKKGCGFRCKLHNAEIKGSSKTSEHVNGLAVDIPFYSTIELMKIVRGLIWGGFSRIKIYSRKKNKQRGWVHADKSKSKIKPKEWFTIKEV